MLPGHLASAVSVLQGTRPDGNGHAEVVRVPVAEVGAPSQVVHPVCDVRQRLHPAGNDDAVSGRETPCAGDRNKCAAPPVAAGVARCFDRLYRENREESRRRVVPRTEYYHSSGRGRYRTPMSEGKDDIGGRRFGAVGIVICSFVAIFLLASGIPALSVPVDYLNFNDTNATIGSGPNPGDPVVDASGSGSSQPRIGGDPDGSEGAQSDASTTGSPGLGPLPIVALVSLKFR